MFAIKTFARGATALALTLGAAGAFAAPALADSANIQPGVKSMSVDLHRSGAPQVTVRNVDNSHQIGSLDLEIQQTKVAFQVGAEVECTGTEFEDWKQRTGTFLSDAVFGVGDGSFVASKTILQGGTSIDHISDSATHLFQLPVAELADPQIDIDPVALVLAAAEQAPNKVQWLRQDHTLMVKLPLRMTAVCKGYIRNKVTKLTIIENENGGISSRVKEIAFKIKYEGDPQLSMLNPQIGQNQQSGGFQAGPQPFEITSAQFPNTMPHHEGACPATKQFRVFYQGKGKGELRIRIAAGNTPLHESGVIAYDEKSNTQSYGFELSTPKGAALNNTIMSNLRVFVVTKAAGAQAWSNDYKLMDQAVWKTRCTPVLNPSLGTNQNGVGGYQNGNGTGAKPLLPLRKPAEPVAPVRKPVQ